MGVRAKRVPLDDLRGAVDEGLLFVSWEQGAAAFDRRPPLGSPTRLRAALAAHRHLRATGHVPLETTQRYMHLSQAAPREGTRALEASTGGGGVEALEGAAENVKEDEQ
jgi:hypothetical protein